MSDQEHLTPQQERKIAEVREEIDVLQSELKSHQRNCHHELADECAYAGPLVRILAREQAALADLLRGWREKGDGNGRG